MAKGVHDDSSEHEIDLPLEGPGAPPRSNGELAFEEPWQGRALAMAVILCEQGHFTWSDFQQALIGEIATWEARPESQPDEYRYWDHWQSALENLASRNPLAPNEIEERATDISSRPHGWDH